VNVLAQLYPIIAPIITFIIIFALTKWLSKPDTLAAKLENLADATNQQFEKMKEEKDKQIEALEDRMYKQEKESWDKMNGLRGDIIRIQTKLNGDGWRRQH